MMAMEIETMHAEQFMQFWVFQLYREIDFSPMAIGIHLSEQALEEMMRLESYRNPGTLAPMPFHLDRLLED